MKARNRIKPLLTLCCALLLVAAGVFGTLAYLTGTDTVNNTFTVGNVKITLDEAKVNTDGTPVVGADRVKTNEYHLLPGHTYTKDPTVTVKTGSDASYVRMKVTFNNAKAIIALCTSGAFWPTAFWAICWRKSMPLSPVPATPSARGICCCRCVRCTALPCWQCWLCRRI